jgi:hypothetical protein
MNPPAVTATTTISDINQMLITHSNPLIHLIARAGMHHFETVETFPCRLNPEMSMESAGIICDTHIRFKISMLGGSPPNTSKSDYYTNNLFSLDTQKRVTLHQRLYVEEQLKVGDKNLSVIQSDLSQRIDIYTAWPIDEQEQTTCCHR